jgi:AcrR family transcriptional regulator
MRELSPWKPGPGAAEVTVDQMAAPRRRARLRAATIAEIKAAALAQMDTSGADTISLRGIARDMGMTPRAIYTYYDTRDALISDLIADVYNQVADMLETVLAGAAEQQPAAQVLAVATAYRDWAVANPDQFQLIYGNPVPGYRRPPDSPAVAAEHRACTVLLTLVRAAWPTPQAAEPHDWNEFKPGFAAAVRASFPALPPAAAALALRLWGRMHGLVALEAYGHLDSQVTDPAQLYHQEMLDLARSLGLSSPTP